MHGLPAGRGHKGGVPKRQRSRTVAPPELVVPRPATLTSPIGCTSSTKLYSSDGHTPHTSATSFIFVQLYRNIVTIIINSDYITIIYIKYFSESHFVS